MRWSPAAASSACCSALVEPLAQPPGVVHRGAAVVVVEVGVDVAVVVAPRGQPGRRRRRGVDRCSDRRRRGWRRRGRGSGRRSSPARCAPTGGRAAGRGCTARRRGGRARRRRRRRATSGHAPRRPTATSAPGHARPRGRRRGDRRRRASVAAAGTGAARRLRPSGRNRSTCVASHDVGVLELLAMGAEAPDLDGVHGTREAPRSPNARPSSPPVTGRRWCSARRCRTSSCSSRARPGRADRPGTRCPASPCTRSLSSRRAPHRSRHPFSRPARGTHPHPMRVTLVVVLVAVAAGALGFTFSARHELDLDASDELGRLPRLRRFLAERFDQQSLRGLLVTVSFVVVLVVALAVGGCSTWSPPTRASPSTTTTSPSGARATPRARPSTCCA